MRARERWIELKLNLELQRSYGFRSSQIVSPSCSPTSVEPHWCCLFFYLLDESSKLPGLVTFQICLQISCHCWHSRLCQRCAFCYSGMAVLNHVKFLDRRQKSLSLEMLTKSPTPCSTGLFMPLLELNWVTAMNLLLLGIHMRNQ